MKLNGDSTLTDLLREAANLGRDRTKIGPIVMEVEINAELFEFELKILKVNGRKVVQRPKLN